MKIELDVHTHTIASGHAFNSAFGACRFQQFYFNITYFQKSGFNFLIPVSYTHLDVYKRQDVHRLSYFW